MKVLITLSIIVLLSVGSVAPVFPQPKASFQPSEKAWKEADKLLKKMSTEEKVGQLVHIGINAKFANQQSPFFKDIQRHVAENKIGGIIFFGAPIYETTIIA